jgi:hypothetical protein
MFKNQEWRDWLYEDEILRLAEIDRELERLHLLREPLLIERRVMSVRGSSRARREASRENS